MNQTQFGYRATLIAVIVAAIALAAGGQQFISRNPERPWAGVLFIGGGVLLLVLGRRLYATRQMPKWLTVIGAPWRIQPYQLLLLILALGCAYAAQRFAGESAKMVSPIAAVFAWLAALGLVILGSSVPAPNDETVGTLGPPWSRRELVLVAALALAAFALRIYGNGHIPRGLSGDEGSAGLTALSILDGKLDNLFYVGWYSFPSLFFFVPALSIKLFGNTYAALRAPSAVAGALTVVGLYWMARPMFGRVAAGLSAGLLAGMAFHIHFSRIGLQNIWDGLFAVLIVGAFWRGWQSGRRGYFVAAGLLTGLSQYFYTSARLMPLVILGWLALKLATDRRSVRRRWADLSIFAWAAAVTFLPLGLFFYTHPDDFGAPVNRFSILATGWLERASLANNQPEWQILAHNYWLALLGYTSQPMLVWYHTGKPMLLALPAGLFVLGICLALIAIRDARYWLALLWLSGVAAIGALTDSTPAGQRYVVGAPPAAFVAGVALATLAEWIAETTSSRRVVYGLAASVVGAAALADFNFYFVSYVPTAGYVDANTETASRLGEYLADYPKGSQLYFFGAPRMAYEGFSTIAFLAPQVEGIDVLQPLAEMPDWTLTGPRTAFVFLPERQAEAEWVMQRYRGGQAKWVYEYLDGETPLYYLYEVSRE